MTETPTDQQKRPELGPPARWTAVLRVQPQGEENLRWVHLSYTLGAKAWREIIDSTRSSRLAPPPALG